MAETTLQRREAFDKFLKIFWSEKKIGMKYLDEFLKSPLDLPYHGSVTFSKKRFYKLIPY